MILQLGPENLRTDFHFNIEDANQEKPRFYDSLGVYFSGGIDSTALLLLILHELKLSGVQYSVHCFTVSKHDYATNTTGVVLDVISKKFNVRLHHHNNISNYTHLYNIQQKTFVDLYARYKNMLFFLGNNKMPPKDIKEFRNTLNVNYGDRKDRILYYSPFLLMHKPQILDIFYQLGCEDVLPFTYSCTVQPHIPCNNCYACEERAWGFEMLKKQDPLLAQN